MTKSEAYTMLLFHQRHARAYRHQAHSPFTPKAEKERCREQAHAAEMRAAECQAILQTQEVPPCTSQER